MSARPTLIHLTTTDISLALLLQPQLKAFANAGYDVIGMSAPGPYVAGLADDGVRHEPVAHFTRRMAPHHDALAFAELRRRFRRLRPDIVHTHNPKPGVLGRLAARGARVPAVVNTVHGLYALPTDRAAKRWVVYALERVAVRICRPASASKRVRSMPLPNSRTFGAVMPRWWSTGMSSGFCTSSASEHRAAIRSNAYTTQRFAARSVGRA